MFINQKGNFLPIVGVVILVLVVGVAAFYFGTQQNKTQLVSQPMASSQPSMISSSPKVITSQSEELMEYTSKKLQGNSLKAYTFKYPASWKEELHREEDNFDTLTLAKNNYSLMIGQGPMGGNGCIFEGELPEGPNEDYRNTPFVEIESGIGILRRIQLRSEKPDEIVFGFCEGLKNTKLFGTPTHIGAVSYHLPVSYDEATLKEMDNVVASLKEASVQ